MKLFDTESNSATNASSLPLYRRRRNTISTSFTTTTTVPSRPVVARSSSEAACMASGKTFDLEQAVNSMLNEPGCMNDKAELARRIVALFQPKNDDDDEEEDDGDIGQSNDNDDDD